MKKRLMVLMCAVVASLSLMACGDEKGTCEMCGKEDVKVYKVEIGGEKGKVCSDCKEDIEALKKLADSMGVSY